MSSKRKQRGEAQRKSNADSIEHKQKSQKLGQSADVTEEDIELGNQLLQSYHKSLPTYNGLMFDGSFKCNSSFSEIPMEESDSNLVGKSNHQTQVH